MGDLQVGETWPVRCFIIVTATGAAATLLADITCTIYDEQVPANHHAGTVAEDGHGWYACTDFAPDAAGNWATQWSKTANPEDYTFSPRELQFKVGGGEVTDIKTETASIQADTTAIGASCGIIEGLHDVPALNAAVNNHITDVVGNKTDTTAGNSIISLIKITDADVGTAITAAGTAAAYAIVNSGLGFRGIVTAAVAGVSFTIGTLAGLGAGMFADAVSPWFAYVLRDASSGTGAAPQGEYRQVLTYVTASGLFTTNAFSVAVAVNDDVIITSNILSTVKDLHDTDIPDIHTDVGTVHTDIDAVRARTDRHEITKTWFSEIDDIITCNTDSSDLTLPSVILPNIAGTITHVYAGIMVGMIENTNAGTNGINGPQKIQVKESAAGAYVDAINLVDNQWLLAASTREGGRPQFGTIDIVAQVAAFNKTYNFIIDNNDVDQANLNLCDVQTFLTVSYY